MGVINLSTVLDTRGFVAGNKTELSRYSANYGDYSTEATNHCSLFQSCTFENLVGNGT